MMSDTPVIRRTIRYAGHVQGVGFRYTTASVATRFAVVGYVRNLPDGRVEVVAEGKAEEIQRFQDAVRAAMRDNIHDADVHDSAAAGQFSRFAVAP